jgi:hypothetical protein
MRRLYPTTLLLALAFLIACDNQSHVAPEVGVQFVHDDPAYAKLVNGVGGRDAFFALLESSSHDELAALFAEYGISFEVIDRSAIDEEALFAEDGRGEDPFFPGYVEAYDITSCPQYFPTADRTKWFRLVGAGGPEDHYIDSRGRPAVAVKMLGPIETAARQTTCQTNVGNWGVPAADYDGGHLIGSQLGGWGGRANLVPQHYNFNRGNWLKVENALAKCGRLGNNAVRFVVDIDYPSSSALTPSAWRGDVTIAGLTRRASFTNTSGGGPNGTDQANGMVTWLQNRGCY